MDSSSQAERGHAPPIASQVERPQSNGYSRSPSSDGSKVVSGEEILSDSLKGWARAAAIQSLSHNLSHHRRYDTLWHRLLLDQQSKITSMEETLAELDKEDGGQPEPHLEKQALDKNRPIHYPRRCSYCKHISHFESQPLDQHDHETGATLSPLSSPLMGRAYELEGDDIKDHLIETLFHRLKQYSESVLLLHQLRKLPRTSRREWSSLYHTLKGEKLLEGSEWNFMSFQDDYLSTKTERADRTFAALVYGDAPIPRFFRWIFKDRDREYTKSKVTSKATVYLRTGGMESLKKGLIAAGTGVILMVPIGILLLQPLDKAQSLGVVICFGAAFIFIMTLLNMKLEKMLISISAYLAVLVSFLANTQEGKA
ncbi:hypothetical protein F4677DRAFT_50768 [Hypoxylon crocopeplum]|nr:hypothetical protein F4677DRAFT_50768 [Hypoxylon crocopeplum]